MTRLRWGALLWIAGLVTVPAQLIAAAQWPQRYSWTSNLISDLGVTSCDTFDVGTRVERYICSPAHLLVNGSFIVVGVTMLIGSLLLWSAWPRRRTGRVAMGLLAAGGVFVLLVGVFPWDTHPEQHDVVALAQAVTQWIGMILLAVASRGSTAARWICALTIVSLIVSVLGFVLFVDGIGGGPSETLGRGLIERVAFDTLTLWSAVVGFVLLKTFTGTSTRVGPPRLTGSLRSR
jgi:hypothetical membrane protein